MNGGLKRVQRSRVRQALRRRAPVSVPNEPPGLLPRIMSIAATLKSAVLNITGALVFMGFSLLLYKAITSPAIVILPISLPKELAEKGYSADGVALQLRADLINLIHQARSSKITASVLTQTGEADINVPQTGVSLEAIAAQVRSSFGLGRLWRVSGGIASVGDKYRLNLVIEDTENIQSINIDSENNNVNDIISTASNNIIGIIDPYILASLFFDKNSEKAIEIANNIIYKSEEGDENVAWAHILLSAIHYNRNNLADAILEAEVAISISPRNPVAHLNRGSALLDQGKFDEALDELEISIALDPSYAYPHIAMGNALRAKARALKMPAPEEAIEEYRRAIGLDPGNAVAHYALGNALKGQNKLDEAATEFKKSIAMDPSYAFPHDGLGKILRDQDKSVEADFHFRRAHELSPKVTSDAPNISTSRTCIQAC